MSDIIYQQTVSMPAEQWDKATATIADLSAALANANKTILAMQKERSEIKILGGLQP